MDVPAHLTRLGGVAGRATLVSLTSRAAVDRALANGTVVRDARGRYAVPVADEAVRAASALTGVVSHRSAALRWGWELKTVPRLPDVTVPRKRRVQAAHRDRVSLHYADLQPAEVRRLVTSPRRTLTVPGTEAAAPCVTTRAATTTSSPAAGPCSGSRGRTSCTIRRTSGGCSPR